MGAGVAAGAGAGATAEVGGDAVWISSAYPGSEQAKRNKTVMWQTGLFADRRVFTAAENILFMKRNKKHRCIPKSPNLWLNITCSALNGTGVQQLLHHYN